MMLRLLLSRLLRAGLALWALTSLVFLLSRLAPESADLAGLPDAADLSTLTPASSASRQLARQARRHRLGLDQPLFYFSRERLPSRTLCWHWHGRRNQYHRWLSQLVRGQLGVSLQDGQPVAARLGDALTYTLPLTATAALLTAGLAVALALRLVRQPWWRRPVLASLTTLFALPQFALALLLLLLFANPATLAWFPAYGLSWAEDTGGAGGPGLLTYAHHLALPLFTLVLAALPELTWQLQAALTHELSAGYVATARAKGLPEATVLRRHALRNALLPALTVFTELLPALAAGAVVVEVIFAIPGTGRLLAEAAATRDYPLLLGGVLLVGSARLLALVLADVGYFLADPRVRWQR